MDQTNTVQQVLSKPYQNHPILDAIKKIFEQILENNYYIGFMTVITIYSLFEDDIRVLSTNKKGDVYFSNMNILCLALFVLEIILASVAKQGYFLGFFFWLDFLSTLTLLFDIGQINNQIFGGGGNPATAAQLARAGRASRVGTRASRVVRIIRFIRLMKLYKHAQQALEKEIQIPGEDVEETGEGFKDSMRGDLNKALIPLPRKKDIQNDDNDSKQQRKIYPSELPILRASLIQQRMQSNALDADSFDQERKKKIKLMRNTVSKNYYFEMYLVIQRTDSLNQQIEQVKNQRKKKSLVLEQTGHLIETLKEKHIKQVEASTEEKPLEVKVEETKVGQKLTELTNRKVIAIVMSVLFSIPIFDIETYREDYVSFDSGLDLIQQCALFNQFINYHSQQRMQLIYLKYNLNSTCCAWPSNQLNYLNMRVDDIQYHSNFDNYGQLLSYAVVSVQQDSQLNAILSIIRTIFVSIILSVGAVIFSKDIQDLLLTPLENMIKRVKRISENPLEAAEIEENEALLDAGIKSDKQEQNLETFILENLIIKIGALLALGFGEAGSQIIAENMKKGGQVDPLIQGKKIMAIFGFCDIRNFTDATEVLQTDVMVFVNQVAEIVHGVVENFGGSANKNIGDAFLLVWKFKDSEYYMDRNNNLRLHRSNRVSQVADLSVLSFVKVIGTMTLNHEELKERLPNYSVKMGFGLHVGWAIEGAIGSEFKIDASYLSPHVNMASRLEAATKQFGTEILLSGNLRDLCTTKSQFHLRQIDRVTVKGSIQPIDLYTVDVSIENLLNNSNGKFIDKFDTTNLTRVQRKKMKVINRRKKEKIINGIQNNKIRLSDLWYKDKDIASLRIIFIQNQLFYEKWSEGFNHYIKGNWTIAEKIFYEVYDMVPVHPDGPSKTLLNFMQQQKNLLVDWKGFRELTDK